MLCFNFGVNKVAVQPQLSGITGGWKASDVYNRKAFETLTGDVDDKRAMLGGLTGAYIREKKERVEWLQNEIPALFDDADQYRTIGQHIVAERLEKIAQNYLIEQEEINKNLYVVRSLGRQVRTLFREGAHKKEGINAYKMAARVLLLTHLIEGIPLYNCKSGKDRTGMLDAEVKLLATMIYRDKNGEVPEPDEPLSESDQKLFHNILLNSGNHEIQALNTGRPGYMINADSVRKQVGDPAVWRDVIGSSGAVRS